MYDHAETRTRAGALRERVVAFLSDGHVGRQNAIKARDLAALLDERERAVREAISQARKDGALILSAISPPYGYFMAENADEWREFRNRNLLPRAYDILETGRAMARAARDEFGPAVQLLLFDDKPEMVA